MDSRTLYIRKLILLSRIKKRYDRIVSLSLKKIEFIARVWESFFDKDFRTE